MEEINAVTVYSKGRVKDFLQVYYFEKIRGIRIIINILIFIVIVTFFTKKERSVLDIVTFIFASFGIIEINTSMLPILNLYKLAKKKDSIIDSKITYTFKKNNFILNKNEYIDYNTLNKVIETDASYYLYVNKDRALIVDKESLTNQNINTLTDIFKTQVSTYIYKNVR